MYPITTVFNRIPSALCLQHLSQLTTHLGSDPLALISFLSQARSPLLESGVSVAVWTLFRRSARVLLSSSCTPPSLIKDPPL